MKERPILFSAPMVRALLAGTKTQTRRVVNPQGAILTDSIARGLGVQPPARQNQPVIPCPYGVIGDRLYVREAFYFGGKRIADNGTPWVFLAYAERPKTTVLHPTLTQFDKIKFADESPEKPWREMKLRPGIHLPKWAIRLTLEIVGVRVERLQDISESDACWEGIEIPEDHDYVAAYRRLWESINGPDSWALNPWVWVVEFKKIGGAQ